ncbi:DNA topoisomerase 3-alpha, partial [Bienertia sinuspersici]
NVKNVWKEASFIWIWKFNKFNKGIHPKLKCNCGNDAVIRTVKNGPNVGSRFYGCPMWPDTKCQMFKLIDGNNVDVEDLQFRLLENGHNHSRVGDDSEVQR